LNKFPKINEFYASKGKLKHKKFGDLKKSTVFPYYIDSSTIGHLWIYNLVDKKGFDYIIPILDYAKKVKSCLFEWNIDEDMMIDLKSFYKNEEIFPELLINSNLDLKSYYKLLENAKTHRNEYNILSKLLVMLHKYDNVFFEKKDGFRLEYPKKDLLIYLNENAPFINSLYLAAIQFYEDEQFDMSKEMSSVLYEISKCNTTWKELKYYPKQKSITNEISIIENFFINNWYWIDQQNKLVFLKYIYNLRIFQELSASLLGSNGILAAISARVIFDNFWQTKYLIDNEEIDSYEKHCFDRMQLYYAKEIKDEKSFDIFGIELNKNLYNSIPLNADYFQSKGSVREICTNLGIKDMYDRCYEFNSEFVHGSITGLYFGLLETCNNKQHLQHLTINRTSSRHIDSLGDIINIINLHGQTINGYLGCDFLPTFDLKKLTFGSRDDFADYINTLHK
jgi:hypothetical protein